LNKKITQTAALIALVFLLVNSAFVALNYIGDSVPEQWVKHRITQAIKRHNITTDKYPLFRYGLPSIYSLIGIDQISDCLTYMHALYRDPDRLKNAVAPGYRDIKGRDHSNLCVVVKQIAFNEVPQEKLLVKHKIRLWHGAKTALLFALPKLNFFQINTLIKQVSYVLYCLLAFVLFYHNKKTGIAFIPVAVVGIFASGITVLGGITHSLPYLVTVFTALGLAAAPAGSGGRFQYLWVAAMGSVLAYFYEVDGSLMLGFGLVLFCAYFHTYAQLSNKEKWKHTVLLLLLFGGSIFLSLVFKQLIGFFYFDPDAVWADFVGEIKYRMYGEYQGSRILPLTALTTQFERYYFAVLNWHAASDFLKFTGTWGWLPAITLSVWAALKHRTVNPLSDLAAFGLIGTAVIARYLIMANHSQIHTIFVSRYLFLLFGIAWAANIWFLWSGFEKNETTGNSRPAGGGH
jgi:hypothetical protein